MGSRLFEEIREQRGLCYSIAAMDRVLPDLPLLYVASGLASKKCLEAYGRIKEIVRELAQDGPKRGEFERAKAYAAGKKILAFESTGMVARYAARQVVVFGERPDPDRYVAEIEKVTISEIAEVAANIDTEPGVACVGPHTADEFRGV